MFGLQVLVIQRFVFGLAVVTSVYPVTDFTDAARRWGVLMSY